MTEYLMSLDLGGSMAKALLVESKTGEVFSAEKAWASLPAPEYGGVASSLDVPLIWQSLGEISHALLKKAHVQPEQVLALAVTSMRHTTVVTDEAGEVLLATPNLDARALAEAVSLAEDHGERIYEITGHWPSPIMAAARLKWLQEKEPERYARAAKFFTLADWVAYKLTGQHRAEASLAAETMLLDLKSRNWSDEILKLIGLPASLLPKVVNAGEKIGELSQEVSEHLGLKPGLSVAAGGADTQAGLVGMGLTALGKLGIVAGSTTPVVLTTDRPFLDAEHRTWAGLTLIPGQYICESNAGSMGSALDLFARMLYSDSHHPLHTLNQEASKLKPGETTILSTAGAQVFNGSAVSIPLDSLTLSTMAIQSGVDGRPQVSRSILEGMAYGVLANFDQIRQVASTPADQTFLGGGMSRSALWPQIVSDLLDLPVRVSSVANVTAFGAALCAGVCAGLFKDLPTAADALVKTARDHQPEQDAHLIYKDNYESWNSIRENRGEADSLAIGHIMTLMNASPEEAKAGSVVDFKPKIFASADLGERSLEILREIGELDYQNYLETGQILSGDDLAEALAGAHVFITEMDILDAGVIAKLPDLRLVVVCRGNPVNIDISACSAAGIPVVNTPGRNADAVADLTLAYVLSLLRRMGEATAFLHEPDGEAGDMGRMTQAFTGLRGDELWKQKVGLVGCGAVGRKVIERLLPFGAEVSVYDPFLSSDEIKALGASKLSFDELLSESDIVSLHSAVTPETEGMINAEAFAKMKDGAFFLNTARAALVDQAAMLEALRSGKLKGAALDVFAEEPPASDDPLLQLPNLIATPHIGGNTNQLSEHQGMILIDELKRLMAGERPRHILNPEALETFSWTGKKQVDEAKLAERKSEPGPGMRDLDIKPPATEPQRAQAAELPKPPQVSVIPQATPARPVAAVEEKGFFAGIKKILGFGGPKAEAPTAAASNTGAAAGIGFEPLFSRFLSKMETDPGIIEFSKGKNISYAFDLKDFPQPFFMAFNEGVVKAGFGEIASPADVKLKMAASVLVDIIRQRINPTKAAMTGKLSFSGDTAKALTLAKLNLKDVYDQSCTELGVSGEAADFMASGGAGAAPAQAGKPPVASAAASAAGLEAVFAAFLDRMTSDPELIAFSQGKAITYTFDLKEMDKPFYMSFDNGTVDCGMGEPSRPVDVKLKMPAAVLVDIIRGRINPTKAAMTGKLSFSGDTAKALSLSKLNLKNAYDAACQALGSSGEVADLLQAPAATPPAASAAPAEPRVAAAPAQAAGFARAGDVRDEILDVLNELYQRGLITSTGGNISARTDDNPNEVWITPSGVFKGDLSPDKMVRIDLDGNVVGDCDYSASSERHVHCAIYRMRPDLAAVIHSHSPKATLLGITQTEFLPISTEAAFIGELPVAPFMMPGTKELSLAVAERMGEKNFACIMQNHGLVVGGSSVRKAADTTEIVEETASKLLTCRQMGVSPVVLPEEAVKALREMGAMLG